MLYRKVFILFWLIGISAGIGYLFWEQEVKYTRPTPVPANYSPPLFNTKIDLPEGFYIEDKPLFVHFFNPDCPCSRFNIRHFNSLVKRNKDRVNFKVVIPSQASLLKARNLIEGGIDILIDNQEVYAVAFGVYSTPQAAILDETGTLYYRGNYNRARYCTLKNSNYAEIALNELLAGNPLPDFGSFATVAYGCELNQESSIF